MWRNMQSLDCNCHCYNVCLVYISMALEYIKQRPDAHNFSLLIPGLVDFIESQDSNEFQLAFADYLLSSVKALKQNDGVDFDDMLLSLAVWIELIHNDVEIANKVAASIKSKNDIRNWTVFMSLPARGWYGSIPPKLKIEQTCDEEAKALSYYAGTELEALPLCRMDGLRLAGMVRAWLEDSEIEQAVEQNPQQLSAMAHNWTSLMFSSDPEYQYLLTAGDYTFPILTVSVPEFIDILGINQAHAAAGKLLQIGGRLLVFGSTQVVKYGTRAAIVSAAAWVAKDVAREIMQSMLGVFTKKGLHVQAFLAGKTNLRSNPFMVLFAASYVYSRTTEDCIKDESCQAFGEETKLSNEDQVILRGQAEKLVMSTMKKIVVDGKYKKSNVDSEDGYDSICYSKSTTHGYVFELLLLAYYHALDEFNVDVQAGDIPQYQAAKPVTGIQTEVRIPLLEKNKDGSYKIFTTFTRYIDIQLGESKGAGKDEDDLEWIEAKSYQAFKSKQPFSERKVEGNAAIVKTNEAALKSKWKRWTYHKENAVNKNNNKIQTSAHRQFFLDRVGTTKLPDKAKELTDEKDKNLRQLAGRFTWQLQSWEECYRQIRIKLKKPKEDLTFWVDTGVSHVWGKVCDQHKKEFKSKTSRNREAFKFAKDWMSQLPKPPTTGVTNTTDERGVVLASLGYTLEQQNNLFFNPFNSFSAFDSIMSQAALRERFGVPEEVQQYMDAIADVDLNTIDNVLDYVPSIPFGDWFDIDTKVEDMLNALSDYVDTNTKCKGA